MEAQTNVRKIMFFMPSFGGGGGEKIVSQISLYIPKEIEKIIVAFSGKPHYQYNGRIILLNVHLSLNIFSKLFALVMGCIKLRKIIKEENPDYVVSFGSITSIINIFASNKSVVRIGNPISKGHERWLEMAYPLLVKLFFNKAKKIIAISQGSKNELVKSFGVNEDKIKVIYNFIDIQKTKELANEQLESEYQEIFKHPVIINVANLVEQKGQEYLIRSFKLVKDKIKDAKLVFIGKGHLEPSLKKMAQTLGVESDVHFLGWQKNPFKFIAKSTVFALPSLWEGFGIVILEAMACGVPVIAFDCPFGPKEILSSELDINTPVKEVTYVSSGVLVPLPHMSYDGNQEDYFAKGLMAILTNESLRQGIIQSSEKRVSFFNAQNFLKGYTFLWE